MIIAGTEYLTRQQIAKLLDINVNSVRNMHDQNRIQAEYIKNGKRFYYPKPQILDWVKTKPVRKVLHKKAWKNIPHDIYNIQKIGKRFVYSGDQVTVILFCQPALLNRHNYEIRINRTTANVLRDV